jgi:hypothetical protein
MPTISTAKLIGAGIGLLAVIAFLALAFSWRSERNHLLQWQGEVISATVDAANLKDRAGKPAKLAAKDVPAQIRYLGKALADVKQKTAEIQALDAQHARAVESRQTSISQESSHDYQAALARVRADYAERLRRISASRADQGGGGKPSVPGVTAVASRPGAAAAEGGLPPEDALIATEQALQLQAILDWGKKVGIVRP